MDPVSPLADDALDLANPLLAAILRLEGGSCEEAAILHGEDEGVEDGAVPRVERAVDEYALVVFTVHQPSRPCSAAVHRRWYPPSGDSRTFRGRHCAPSPPSPRP